MNRERDNQDDPDDVPSSPGSSWTTTETWPAELRRCTCGTRSYDHDDHTTTCGLQRTRPSHRFAFDAPF